MGGSREECIVYVCLEYSSFFSLSALFFEDVKISFVS